MQHSILFLFVALLVSFWLPSTAEARHPRGSTMTGVVQSVDHASRWITFARADGASRRFVYGKLARFWHGTSDSLPSSLNPGMNVQLNLHNPLFGPDYATQIVLLAALQK
ncbi:hypothetical protein [Prosthecobacter algae]